MLTVIVGLVGTLSLLDINSKHSENLEMYTVKTAALADMRELYLQQRLIFRAIAIDLHDKELMKKNVAELNGYEADMLAAIDVFGNTVTDSDAEKSFLDFKTAYLGEYAQIKEQYLEAAGRGDSEAALAALAKGTECAAKITAGLQKTIEDVGIISDAKSDDLARNMNSIIVIQIVAIILAAIIAMSLGMYTSEIISKPINHMAETFIQFGNFGNFEIDAENAKIASDNAARKDEIGTCAKAALVLISRMVDMQNILTRISEGDLSVTMPILSQQDSIGIAVSKVVDNLNGMFTEIDSAAAQVSVGSRQISEGAQSLAQGSSQQAAAVEELSVSISEVAEKTKGSADMATDASNLAEVIKHNAEKGNRQMDQMLSAVKEIQEASQSISKVIKVIDDIAFQTNILALNAAVEAARAGQHGKGFAVVAEEVRNLAAKSAEAAKDTEGLIANSVEKSELGARIAAETAVSLSEIVTGINESGQIIGNIARSAEEQSLAITQINKGIEQVAQVVQENSAASEESAAASEEMSEQSKLLEELIAQFKLRNNESGSAPRYKHAPSSVQLELPGKRGSKY